MKLAGLTKRGKVVRTTRLLARQIMQQATFVRAALSNRLSIFMQDSATLFVTHLIGMLL